MLDALEREHKADLLAALDRVEIAGRAYLQHPLTVLVHRSEEAGRLSKRLSEGSLWLPFELDEDGADLEPDAACLEQRQPGVRERPSFAEPELAVGEVEEQIEMGVGDHGASVVLRPRQPTRHQILRGVLTSFVLGVSLCDGHTKGRPWIATVAADIPASLAARMSFERPTSAGSRADQSTIRRANLGVVLQQIAGGAPRSRARVAAETGLTRGTVSSLVGELIELELLRETGEDARSGRVGRPAQTLELADRVVAIGLEVNVDYLALCVEDLTGAVRHERHVKTDNRDSEPGPVLDRLADLAREALDVIAGEGLVPVGGAVALPGLVDQKSGTLLRAPNLGWDEIPVVSELAIRVPDLPILVDNEANLAAVAEHWQGVAQDIESFICVFGEVGVGAGIFVGGELYRGAHGYGGEFGHITVDPDGPPCKCGSNGCLETYIGQDAIARRAGITVGSGALASSAASDLVQRARAGDPQTLESLSEAGSCLGAGLASAVNLFDLEAVIVGGCFGPLAPWLVDGVRDALERRVLSAAWSPCDVRASTFGEGAAVRGACALTLRSVLTEPWIVAERRSQAREAAV